MRRALLAWILLLLLLPLPVRAAAGTGGPMPTPTASSVASLRPRPDARPFDYPTPNGDDATGTTRGGGPLGEPAPDASLVTPAADAVGRLDDPVLQWLPEIAAASAATGTPRSLIAGVMHLESGGDPETISVAGAQGLMQVMPAEFGYKGIAAVMWRDPATNVMTGARILAERSGAGWETAVAYYFGIGCDAYGTCTQQYATVVLGWANYYAAVLGDGIWYDAARIPAMPSTPTPGATKSPTGTPSATPPEATSVPTDVPTVEPTEPPEPTMEPTLAPAPTDVPPLPTEVTVEIPVELPTEEAVVPAPKSTD